MKKSIVTISNLAIGKLRNIAYVNDSKYILFTIQGGGCNGFKYSLEPTNKVEKINEIIEITNSTNTKNKFNLQVCGKSLMYLLGTHIDWKSNTMGEGFHFENPNATSSCGCGETFSI